MKLLRSANEMTQEQVADYLGIHRSAYSNYEDGRREPPIEILGNLANLWGCDLSTLYEESEEEVKSQLFCAFRTDNLSEEDMKTIADFKHFVLSYLKMEKLLNT